MVPVQDTSLDTAFSIVAGRLVPGAALLGYRPLSGGVSAAVHVLDISSPRGFESLVVRRHGAASWKQLPHDVTQTEFRLLTALHDARLPVPQPLLLDASADVLPSPYYVMQFVHGSSEFPPAFLDAALRAMASFLALLHSLDAHTLALPSLPKREDPVESALQFVHDDPMAASLRDAITRFRSQHSPSALLHGDFWPGNILWKDHAIAGVLDWEDAAIGPAASDVACCRAELNVLFGATAASTFTEYYRAASVDPLGDLELWDFYVSSAALAALHQWGLPPEVEALRRARTSEFLTRAIESLTTTGTSSNR